MLALQNTIPVVSGVNKHNNAGDTRKPQSVTHAALLVTTLRFPYIFFLVIWIACLLSTLLKCVENSSLRVRTLLSLILVGVLGEI